MFKLNLSKTFTWPVKFTVIDEAGRQQSHEIKLVFNRISNEDSKQLLADIQSAEADRKQAADDGAPVSAKQQIDDEVGFLMNAVAGWEGVADQDGSPLAFSRDNLTALVNAVPNLVGEIWSAFFTATVGGEKKRKN